jgi:hypothetical protein
MLQRFRICFRSLFRDLPECLLVVAWGGGCLLGILCGMNAGDTYFSLMRGAVRCSVSIVGLAFSVYLPFLLSAFAVYWNRPSLMYIVCVLKAWSFTLAAYGILNAFGSAGWLVRFLVQFSDILLLCPLCWFFLRHIRGNSAQWKRDLWICSAAAAAVCSIDYCVVSRFLVMLTQI